ISIKIDKPTVPDGSIPNVFIEGENINEYFKLKKPANNKEIYVKLQFSEERIEKTKANFIRKEYEVMVFPEGAFNTYTPNLGFPHGTRTERRVEEAEGAIIAKLTKMLSDNKS
ncbi:MAG: hypothetical protein NTV30_08525, partial [Chloroflexi bacterium]|nr:hypothetical protein [Chloroflexota bacterium]